MLSAIVTLSCDGSTLGDVRAFLREAARFGLPLSTTVLDGRHVAFDDAPEVTVGSFGEDLAAVEAFCGSRGDAPDVLAVRHGVDLCVDLLVSRVLPIGCGEHVGSHPENVLVNVHPACVDC